MASFKFILDFLAEMIDGDRNFLLGVPENLMSNNHLWSVPQNAL